MQRKLLIASILAALGFAAGRSAPALTAPRLTDSGLSTPSVDRLEHQEGTATAVASGVPEGDAEYHVVVLHSNDIHGQVLPRPAVWLKDVNPVPDSGGLPRLAATLNRVRREAEAEGAIVVTCDGGDWFQGTPEGQVERGRPFVEAFAAAGHDGVVVGNHEFDHGVEVLLGHLAAIDLPALLANVRLPDGSPLPGTRDHVTVERGGLRVALVGLLTTTTPFITHRTTKDLVWESPAEALTRVRAELGSAVDLVIPVTHIGIESDRELARAHPDLPLIVGGHSHTFLRKGVREGETLIVQAGAKASVIGRVDLWLDADLEVTRSTARHIEMYAEPGPAHRNERVDALAAALADRAAGQMDEVVGVLGAPLEVTRRPLVNASSGNFICDILRERTGADIAIQNRGGTRAPLMAGPVTRRDLFMMLPFDNHLETLTMSGADVIELFRRSIEDEHKRSLEFSGVVLEVRRVDGKPRLVRVLVGGEPLDPGGEVRLTTNSFLAAGGDGWRLFADQKTREIDSIFMRDLLEESFDGGPLVPSFEQRYVVLP